MPQGDGTGPRGQGRGSGRGRMGGGMGQGRGQGKGRGGSRGAGVGGECICPNCKTAIPHQPGIPCTSLSCPQCGASMIRKTDVMGNAGQNRQRSDIL